MRSSSVLVSHVLFIDFLDMHYTVTFNCACVAVVCIDWLFFSQNVDVWL